MSPGAKNPISHDDARGSVANRWRRGRRRCHDAAMQYTRWIALGLLTGCAPSVTATDTDAGGNDDFWMRKLTQ